MAQSPLPELLYSYTVVSYKRYPDSARTHPLPSPAGNLLRLRRKPFYERYSLLLVALLVLISAFPVANAQAAIVQQNFVQEPDSRTSSETSPAASEKSDPALAQAESLVHQGKLDEAEQSLHRYLDQHPSSSDAHFLLGFIYFQQLHQKAALAAPAESPEFSTLGGIDAATSDAKAKASLAEYTAGAKYQTPSAFDLKIVALDYVLLKDYPDADMWLTKSLAANPKDASAWYYLGRTKYNENRFEEAISAFREYLKLEPKSVKGEDNLGLSYQGLGRTQDAIAAYKTAILWQKDLLNQDPGPFLNLGVLLLDDNQPDQAVSYLLQSVSIAPDYARAHEHLGKAYDRLGQLAKAQAELEKAVELAPKNARLHYILGQVYRKEGLTEKARLEFDRSSELRRNTRSEDNNE